MAADSLDPPEDPYRNNPVGWVHTKLGERLWSKQREIAEAVRDHRHVAVKASHGVGKSRVASRIVCHWIDTHPAGEAFAVSSAPKWEQVTAVLWRELAGAHRAGNLPGRITQNAQWKIGSDLVAIGRKPADHDEHGFQGIHARRLLVVLDEACGIPRSLWTGAGTLGTNADARMLAIGNPDDPTSEFAAICEGASEDGSSGLSARGWWVITVSTFDTPNFTDEGATLPREVREQLPSQVWLQDRRVEYGEGTPLWQSKVLGRFPKDASVGVVPWSWLKACQGEEAAARIGPLRVPVELGVDVAASDLGDETVVYERCGMAVGRRWAVRSSDPNVVIELVEQAIREAEPSSVKIDAIGVGWALQAALNRSFPGLDVVPVVVSQAAPGEDRTKFMNLRAWIWWQVGRRLAQDRAWDLTNLPDATLNELAAPRYREVNGRIRIEEKPEVRKRIGRSTDNADALLLAFLVPPVAAGDRPAAVAAYRSDGLRGTR